MVGVTAFNLRQYDARLGRWQTPDPYGQHYSPYLAMSNNPVSFTDPDGGFDVYDLQEELWASGIGLSASYSNWDEYYAYRDEQDQYNPGYLVDQVQAFYQYQQCFWWEQVTIAGRTANVYMESERTDERISVYVTRRHKTSGERIFERVWRDAPKRPGYFDGLVSELGAAFLETTHVGLDLVGMVPALGEAADVVNGLIYLAEGDKWNAGISFAAAAVVIGGQAITGARLVAKGADAVAAAEREVTVYRVFGGDARAQGFSWTTTDPRTVSNFRDGAGLPSGGASGSTNTADFLIQGKVNPADIIKSRPARPLDGNKGGLPELVIDPKNVKLNDFSVLNP